MVQNNYDLHIDKPTNVSRHFTEVIPKHLPGTEVKYMNCGQL